MKIIESSHLCYSLNVFPRSSSGYLRNIELIAQNFCEIRKNLGHDKETPFALGLWLDAEAVEELEDPAKLSELKSILQKNNFYVFTVNAFPYGKFHDGPIKDNVYLPNWSESKRKDFTMKVADILSELLPEGVTGSISTLPGGYRKHLERRTSNIERPTSNYEEEIADNLIETADYLADIEKRTGRKIILGIEMEPDCLWESPEEFCEFRKKFLKGDYSKKYIGVCYDTCHQELLEGEAGSGIKYLVSQNVPIAKIQLSAALEADVQGNQEVVSEELANFADPVYLHQTRLFDRQKRIVASFKDIPEVQFANADRIVTHFHMPLYAEEISENFSVAKDELEAVLDLIGENPGLCNHLEIETYTYSVLPANIKASSTEQMITDEYKWVLKQLI